jgi:signal transduction histidine kinase/DNA-binding response OmpR family regulator/ligand-binding sensor domain-containing protein
VTICIFAQLFLPLLGCRHLVHGGGRVASVERAFLAESSPNDSLPPALPKRNAPTVSARVADCPSRGFSLGHSMNARLHTFFALICVPLLLPGYLHQTYAAEPEHTPAIPMSVHQTQLSVLQPNLKVTLEKVWSLQSPRQILRRADGMLWVITPSGLFRFDGYDVRHFHEPWSEPEARLSSWLTCAVEDEFNTLWAGAQYGFKRFDDRTGTFETFLYDSTSPSTISNNVIHSLCSDRMGHVWVGTSHGLNRFDITSRTVLRFYHNPADENSLACDTVLCVTAGSSGVIWAGTLDGLSRFDPSTGKFSNYTVKSPSPFRLPTKAVRDIYQDRDRIVWVSTDAGLSMFDFNRGDSRFFSPGPYDQTAPYETGITGIVEDALGNLWLGAGSRGLLRLNMTTGQFSNYIDSIATSTVATHGTGERFKVVQPPRVVRNIMLDEGRPAKLPGEPDVLWMSGDDAVWRVTVARPGFSRVTLSGRTLLRGTNIMTVSSGVQSGAWLRSQEGTFGRLDLRTVRMSIFRPQKGEWQHTILQGAAFEKDGTSVLAMGNSLYTLTQEGRTLSKIPGVVGGGPIITGRDGTIWFTTLNATRAFPLLARVEPNTGRVVTYPRDLLPGEPSAGGTILTMLEDRNGTIWYGTFGRGLFRFVPGNATYKIYASSPTNDGALKTNVVRALLQDSAGVLWVGTDSGLLRYNAANDTFERFTTTGNEMQDNGHFIRGMAFDRDQNIWLAHSMGISRFDRTLLRFRDFTEIDGLERVQYSSLAFEPGQGIMYATDVLGNLLTFRPAELPTSAAPAKVILTGFRVFESPVTLPEPIHRTREVELGYEQNFFSFRFSALEFLRPEKIIYAYRMVGFDHGWVQAGSRAYAGYTNLDPGRYVFQVKATDANGVWGDSVTSLAVVVHPPWWRTPWANLLFILAGASVLYGAWRYDRKRVQLRHRLDMKDFETRKLFEVDQMKTSFFANVSHEFRTPLTVILAPVEKLISQFSNPKTREDLATIQRNAHRLLHLVNELLDLSKLDAGRLPLQVCATDIVKQLRGLVRSFSSLADRKRIALLFEPHLDTLVAFIDRDKFEKIMTNLLSNALKFTEAGGEVVVSLSRRGSAGHPEHTKEDAPEGWAEVTVTDTGIGIPKGEFEKIFDRFYQVDSTLRRSQGGTGLGLPLTKELVELHRGYIHITSTEEKGRTFVIGLPLGRERFSDEQIMENQPDRVSRADENSEGLTESSVTDEYHPITGEPAGPPSSPLVLLIEDDREVRRYLREYLEKECRILEASDGIEGLESAVASSPDLVISDIMMPRMDGVELCRRLKSDFQTSHIPVILLTARASGEDKLEGLESGADDYIIKPFEAKELRLRAHNLIETRRRLREKYQKSFIFQPKELAIGSVDEHFLTLLMESVERHLADPACDTETLAQDLCMSRMQLNRKLNAVTGHSTHEFLRAQRLNRAARLLQHHRGNVSEVAYDVGFSSPSHFAKVFKEQFGVSPSEYQLTPPLSSKDKRGEG